MLPTKVLVELQTTSKDCVKSFWATWDGTGYAFSPSVAPVTYSSSGNGSVQTTSNTLVRAGTFSNVFTIQTQPGTTGNIWLNVSGGQAAIGSGPSILAGGASRTFGTAENPLPTGDVNAVTDGGAPVTVSIWGA